MGFPESRSPKNHFCPGERHYPASHFYPTKDPVGPRGPRACNAAGIPVICEPSHRKTGRKEPPSPCQPGRKAFTSQRCHLYKPPSISSKSPRRLCFSQGQKRVERGTDCKLRAMLRWKDPTCLAQGLMSTGNNCHVSFELHSLSQAVVSTFLATFHQHTICSNLSNSSLLPPSAHTDRPGRWPCLYHPSSYSNS